MPQVEEYYVAIGRSRHRSRPPMKSPTPSPILAKQTRWIGVGRRNRSGHDFRGLLHRVALARREEQVLLDAVLLGVEIVSSGRPARRATDACRARRCGRLRPPGSGRRGESSTGGARSRTSCAPASGTRAPPGSAPPTPSRGWRWLRRGSGCAGSARMARAIETRWRCPPESFTPRSPMMVSYFVLELLGELIHARDARRRAESPASVASGLEKRHVLANGAVEEKRILQAPRPAACDRTPAARSTDRSQSTSTLPELGVWKAAISPMMVDLPEPDDPTSAVTVPGCEWNEMSCSTVLLCS